MRSGRGGQRGRREDLKLLLPSTLLLNNLVVIDQILFICGVPESRCLAADDQPHKNFQLAVGCKH